MSSAHTPLRPAAAHADGHGHIHDAPAAVQARPVRPPRTLLTSGLGRRLGAAALLTALLWAVVLWALA
jgi:hypothetical protein